MSEANDEALLDALYRLAPSTHGVGYGNKNLYMDDAAIDLVTSKFLRAGKKVSVWNSYSYAQALEDPSFLCRMQVAENYFTPVLDPTGEDPESVGYKYSCVLIPACIAKQHWVLFAILPEQGIIRLFDSIATEIFPEQRKINILDILTKRISFEMIGLKSPDSIPPRSKWKFQVPTASLQQVDSYNCGIYVLIIIRGLLQDKGYFTPEHTDMDRWRLFFSRMLLH